MCRFCHNFDFGTVKVEVNSLGATIIHSGGSTRFPESERFKFCPECGTKLEHSLKRRANPNE